MPRINPVDFNRIDEKTSASLDAIRRKLGMLPNLHATFAQSPTLLQAYLGFAETLGRGRLTLRQRELIALALAQTNGCQYCLSAHSLSSRGAGLSDAVVQAARSGKAEAQQEQALLSLALGMLEQRGRVSDELLAAARSAGLDDGQILEVLGQVVLNLLTNFGNNLAQTRIDFPVVAL